MMLAAWIALAVMARVELIDGRRMRGHCVDMKLQRILALRLSVI
jgi:hypothetical protein